ncbi:hypothetical protein BGZ65_011374, partial [Modicella reniformis]
MAQDMSLDGYDGDENVGTIGGDLFGAKVEHEGLDWIHRDQQQDGSQLNGPFMQGSEAQHTMTPQLVRAV